MGEGGHSLSTSRGVGRSNRGGAGGGGRPHQSQLAHDISNKPLSDGVLSILVNGMTPTPNKENANLDVRHNTVSQALREVVAQRKKQRND